jgi:hypothetical protein
MKNFNILGEKMIGSSRPRAVDQTAMRLGGNGMEENFSSSHLYDEWAKEENFSSHFVHKCGDLEMTLIAVLWFLFLNKGIMVTS